VPPYVILIRRTRVYDTNAARNVARRLRVRIYNLVISGPGFRRDAVGEGGISNLNVFRFGGATGRHIFA